MCEVETKFILILFVIKLCPSVSYCGSELGTFVALTEIRAAGSYLLLVIMTFWKKLTIQMVISIIVTIVSARKL